MSKTQRSGVSISGADAYAFNEANINPAAPFKSVFPYKKGSPEDWKKTVEWAGIKFGFRKTICMEKYRI